MKTKIIMALFVLCLSIMSVNPLVNRAHNSALQESTLTGVYDGHEDYGYNFITQHVDDGSDYTMTFHKLNEAVTKEFDLDSEIFLNQKFEVTYTTKKIVKKDENGFDDVDEIFTIVRLKAL